MAHPQIVSIAESPRAVTQSSHKRIPDLARLTSTKMHYTPHEHMFFQGDTPTGVFEITSGTVTAYRLTADGRRQIQDFASVGDILALGFYDEHQLSAEALTDVTANFIPQAVMDRALQNNADFRRGVFSHVFDMLQSARQQSMLLGFKSAMERTASFLIFLENRFGDPATGYTPILMSRCEIADYLGLTLETVSRMINRLKRQGVIELPQPDKFKVVDRSRLTALSGEDEWGNSEYAARA